MKQVYLAIMLLWAITLGTSAAELPRAEYPRPQFQRSEWINLNGAWSYTFDFGHSGKDRGYQNNTGFSGQITVPFCPESKLSGVGYTDFIEEMWYQRKLEIPAAWSGKKIFLNFGAIDYEAAIYIDGKLVTRHFGGSSSFAVDLTRFVEAGKTHNLVIDVTDKLREGTQTGGKQCTNYFSAGCSYTRTTGIWQTVWMEAVAPQAVKNVQVITDIDQKQLVVKPTFYQESMNTFRVLVKENGKTIAQQDVKASNNSVAVLPMKKMKLWTPESPYLYDVEYQVIDKEGKNIIDHVSSYVGMRKVHIEGNRFYLNNEPYYQRLVLDQGFYPEGIWTAPSDEALKNDILLSKEAGFNGARLHQKVFEERFYYWADKLGYLTWGESASWGVNLRDEEAIRNFISEWSDIVTRDRNHPSLVTWTPTNETWGCDEYVYPRFIKDIYNITKTLDPTRPVNDASGDDHVVTDIWSVHNYEQDGKKLQESLDIHEGKELYRNSKAKFAVYEGQPYMVDEFGGIKWIPEEERNNTQAGWGYGNAPQTEEEFYQRLEGQVDALLALDHVWGYCYTQLTDVEQEQNGIYLYSRKPKFDMKRIKAIFSKQPTAPSNDKKK